MIRSMSIRKIAQWTLYGAAIVMPFIFSYFFLADGVDGKVIYLRGAAFLTVLLLTVMLVRGGKEGEAVLSKIQRFKKDPVAIMLGISMILLILSTVLAYDRTIAFLGEPQRAEGFLTLFSASVLFVSFRLLFEKKEWRKFFTMFSWAGIILFIIGFFQAISGTARPDALSGNPTFLAAYFAFVLFAGLVLLVAGRKEHSGSYRMLGGSASVAAVLGIFLTGTRGNILGLFLSVFVAAIAALIYGKDAVIGKHTCRKIGAVILGLSLLFGGVLVATRHAAVWQHVPGVDRLVQISAADKTTGSRLLYAKESFTYFWSDGGPKRVLLGWGWDNYTFFWRSHYDPHIYYYDPTIADRSHNKFIDMLVMTGVLGLGAYLTLWFFFLRRIVRMLRQDFLQALPFVLFVPVYFSGIFFAFDTAVTLALFGMLLAYSSHLLYD